MFFLWCFFSHPACLAQHEKDPPKVIWSSLFINDKNRIIPRRKAIPAAVEDHNVAGADDYDFPRDILLFNTVHNSFYWEETCFSF